MVPPRSCSTTDGPIAGDRRRSTVAIVRGLRDPASPAAERLRLRAIWRLTNTKVKLKHLGLPDPCQMTMTAPESPSYRAPAPHSQQPIVSGVAAL
jgi:hypothetical protein